ncbi:MAG: peptidoglycan DD-metalloendopeptidase family protein [Thermodesulfobacteriota bacterium]|nr:peptidoglycan DD-metalloendopeptidase family protein [Thermodesulfobacteriota bacterium]
MSSLSKALFVPAIVFFNLLSGHSNATSDPASRTGQDQIKKIESQLSKEQQKLKTFNTQEKDILDLLSDLEQEVAEKRQAVEKLKSRIRLAKLEYGRLEQRLADLENALENAEIRIAGRLVALYKHARKGYFRILADARDLSQFWHRVKYIKSIMEEDSIVLTGLAEEQYRHNKAVLQIKEQLIEKEARKQQEEARLALLRENLEEKVIRLMNIHKEKEFYKTAVKELRLAAQDLKKTLLNIEEKEECKISFSHRFADSKGQLPFPLEGKVIKGDKLFGSGNLDLHKGVFIESSSDVRVKAVFPGRVDFSGNLKGYGEIVIINHGSRFFSISAHLSTRKKDEGDAVAGGNVIGLVGGSGPLNGPRLYFEIRRAGKSLDPLEWLKIR